MKVFEILLPKSLDDNPLPPKTQQHVAMLQQRMERYVDKIFDPKTTPQGREFLKSRLRDDYLDLKDALRLNIHKVAENDISPVEMDKTGENTKYEVYDTQTGQVVGGPYSNLRRALHAADKKDLEYGAHRFSHRAIKHLNEAVHRLPLTHDDFELVKHLMNKPIPAAIATIYISEVIDDDAFNDELNILAETDPGRDVRQMVVDWVVRVMPDQLHRFGQEVGDADQKKGVFSVLHGYDPHMYKAGTDTGNSTSGNAYGYF